MNLDDVFAFLGGATAVKLIETGFNYFMDRRSKDVARVEKYYEDLREDNAALKVEVKTLQMENEVLKGLVVELKGCVAKMEVQLAQLQMQLGLCKDDASVVQ